MGLFFLICNVYNFFYATIMSLTLALKEQEDLAMRNGYTVFDGIHIHSPMFLGKHLMLFKNVAGYKKQKEKFRHNMPLG